jgi:hypothetical protein
MGWWIARLDGTGFFRNGFECRGGCFEQARIAFELRESLGSIGEWFFMLAQFVKWEAGCRCEEHVGVGDFGCEFWQSSEGVCEGCRRSGCAVGYCGVLF